MDFENIYVNMPEVKNDNLVRSHNKSNYNCLLITITIGKHIRSESSYWQKGYKNMWRHHLDFLLLLGRFHATEDQRGGLPGWSDWSSSTDRDRWTWDPEKGMRTRLENPETGRSRKIQTGKTRRLGPAFIRPYSHETFLHTILK